MNFKEATATLAGRSSRKVAHNTYLERIGPRQIALRLHATRILTWDAGGTVRYDSGGWKTVTTKDRLNRFGPLRVSQERGAWFASNGTGVWVPFADGLTYHPARGIRHGGKDAAPLRKKVARYAEAFIVALYAGEVPAPSGGDCWLCLMREEKTGAPLGELQRDREHIRSHVAESYFVPSLLARAVETFANSLAMRDLVARLWGGVAEEGVFLRSESWPRRQLKRALTRYILRQLGEVS